MEPSYHNRHPSGMVFFRESTGDGAGGIQIEEYQEVSRDDEHGKVLLCAACGHEITDHGKRIEVNGSFRHSFKNPLGIVYEIGCFSFAPGCFHAGTPTEEFTWFPGYSWCFALCAGCSSHIGWLYEAGSRSFFGLVLANLRNN